MKSVRAIETNAKWRQLIQAGQSTDETIPLLTRGKIEELARNAEKLDYDYFDMVLLRLYDFLNKIQQEIKSGDMRQDAADRCHISYTATPAFDNYSENREFWNDETYGMFGYHADEEIVYGNSVYNLNQYLKDEFSSDYRRLVVNMDEDVYRARSYYSILKDGYFDYDAGENPVVELREDTIWQLFQMLDTPRKST